MVKKRIENIDVVSNGRVDHDVIMPNHVHLLITIMAGMPDKAGLSDGAGLKKAGIPDKAGMPDRAGMSDKAGMPDKAGMQDKAGMPDKAGMQDKAGTPRAASPTKAEIPKIVNALKSLTSKEFGESMWQRAYYDHIIRNEAEYQRIWKYIDENQARWVEDEYYN